MSHYDDAYEADELYRKKKRKEMLLKMLQKTNELEKELDSRIPKRFRTSLEDLNNWIECSINNNSY